MRDGERRVVIHHAGVGGYFAGAGEEMISTLQAEEFDLAVGGAGAEAGDAQRDAFFDVAGSEADLFVGESDVEHFLVVEPSREVVAGDSETNPVPPIAFEDDVMGRFVERCVFVVDAGNSKNDPPPAADDEGGVAFSDRKGEGAEEVIAVVHEGFEGDLVIASRKFPRVAGPDDPREWNAGLECEIAIEGDVDAASVLEVDGFPVAEGVAVEEGRGFGGFGGFGGFSGFGRSLFGGLGRDLFGGSGGFGARGADQGDGCEGEVSW